MTRAAPAVGAAIPPVHVERTPDPSVMRWVCHDRHLACRLAASARADGSPLRRLLSDGVIADACASGGDLLVRTDAPDRWPATAVAVHDAVLDALRRPSLLPSADQPATSTAPAVPDLQDLVDRIAGPTAAGHGGRIEVTAVDGRVVTVRLHGACRGCPSTTDTLAGPTSAAIHRAHPGAEIRLDDGCDTPRHTPIRLPVRRRRRRTAPSGRPRDEPDADGG